MGAAPGMPKAAGVLCPKGCGKLAEFALPSGVAVGCGCPKPPGWGAPLPAPKAKEAELGAPKLNGALVPPACG